MPNKPSKTPADNPEERASEYLEGGLDEQDIKKPKKPEIVEDDEFELTEGNPDNEAGLAELEKELDMELAGMAAKCIESKPLDDNLLAKIRIEKNNLGKREGLQLALKMTGEPLMIFGKQYADKLDEKTVEMAYPAITSTEQFLEMDAEYKEGVEMERETQLNKLRMELFTISGIILKSRFLGYNLLAMVRINKSLQEAAFGEEKTDPKRLRLALAAKGEKIDCVETMRDGIYAVLVKGEVGMKVLGGKNAYQLDPEIIETIYESLEDPAHFFRADQKLKQYIKELEDDEDPRIKTAAQRLQQIMEELEEPTTDKGDITEMPDEDIDGELAQLEKELDELENGEDDEGTPA